MLNRVRIERFKNIASIEIGLERINILVGSNNSGKSSILQSIQFAISVAQTTSLDDFRFTEWKNNRYSTSLTPNQLIYSPVRDVYSLGFGGVLREPQDGAISVTLEDADLNSRAHFIIRKGRNKNLRIEIEGRELGEHFQNIVQPYSIFVPGLAGIPAFEEFKSEGIVRRSAAKGDANSVFRNILWLLKQNQWILRQKFTTVSAQSLPLSEYPFGKLHPVIQYYFL